MRLVTRYILREHIGPLVFSVTTLTSLLLLNYISKKFGELVGKGLPWNVIGEFFVLSIPFTIAMTLPMAVLISTLYAFSRLAGDSEVTAMMASGIGTRQLMMPVLGVGLALSLVMVGFNDQVLPRSNHRLSGLTSSISQKKPTLALKPQILNEVKSGRLFMWVSQLDTRDNSMRGVTIHDLADPQNQHTIEAEHGTLRFAGNGTDLVLTLYNGFIEETRTNTSKAAERFQRTFFKTNELRVADVANEFVNDKEGGYKGDREMGVCEMQAEIRRAQSLRDSTVRALAGIDPVLASRYPAHIESRTGELYCRAIHSLFLPKTAQAQGSVGTPQESARVNAQSTPPQRAESPREIQTKQVVKNVEYAERSIAKYEVEIQKKFALSFACLVFALLGPPIALMFPRSGVGLTIGVSLSVFSVYYIGLIGGETLGNNLKLSPAIAMWAANAIMTVIGVVLVSRMARRGANARGGILQGMFDRISMLFRKRPAA